MAPERTISTTHVASVEKPAHVAMAVVLAAAVLGAGVGAVSLSTASTGDAGVAFLGYMAYEGDLDASSALAGSSAVLSGSSAAASGAATYVSTSGTAATLAAAGAGTGGVLAL